ncbi:DMT family transporter [Nitratireductor alexandrii]|uniref:DMT family transporter n=1 Tax=Nitratireductor alexandrii TaxID=2448161 RepID=UPI000FDBAA71|nr:DMT family transporter [Nitratireductor alexandrii]
MNAPSVPALGSVLLVAIAAALWGTVGVASKLLYGTAEISPVFVGFVRLALAAPLLLILSLATVGRRTFAFAGRELGAILMIGVSMALYQLFYFTAVATTGVAIATLVTICTAPLMVALLAGGFLGERLTAPIIGALAIGIAGTAMLVGVPSDVGVTQAAVLAGTAWALGSAASFAVFTLFSRVLAPRHHPFTLIGIGLGAGALMLLPVALLTIPASVSTDGMWLLLYIGLVPTGFAYIVFFAGMKRAGATVASIAALTEPLTATLLAWLMFDERLGALGLLGAALLVAAMVLLTRASR